MKDAIEHLKSFVCVVLYYVIGMALLSLPRFYYGMDTTEYIYILGLTTALITFCYVIFIADYYIRKLYRKKKETV